nr:MAG TPA: phosphoprotein [Caudoviricetes sp.]
MILSLELCDNISWKFTQRVFKTYIERLKKSYNKTVTDILQRNLPAEIIKVAECCSDLSISMSRVQADTISILTELKVTDEILKYLPEIKEELDAVEKKHRGECFKAKIESFVEEIRETLNKTKEREQRL